jgi:gliding motility-associated lipoprotein GldB
MGFHILKRMCFSISRIIKQFPGKGLLAIVLFFGFSCKNPDAIKAEIEAIPVSISIDRFDRKFHEATPDQIPELKEKYPFLFPQQFTDSVWIKRQKDSLQLLLQKAVDEKFPKMESLESDLSHLFKHIQYYFPATPSPHTIGLINNVDYQSKSIYADSLLIISLDTYLGKQHPLYEGIPNYIRQQMDVAYLTSHVAEKFVETQLAPPADRTFLAQLIYFGKIEYLKSLLVPHVSEAIRFGYSEEQLKWTQENQKYIWQYFIEKQLLYSTDPSLIQRFLAPAPFSKFYLEIDNQTPGQIGVWLGTEIVKAFCEKNPDYTYPEILALPALTIFQQSNYKPSR